jgi:hypothetical protein
MDDRSRPDAAIIMRVQRSYHTVANCTGCCDSIISSHAAK